MSEQATQPRFREALRLIGRFYGVYVRPCKLPYFSIWFLHVVFAGLLIAPPYLVKEVIDKGIARKDMSLVLWLAGALAGVFAVVALIGKVRTYWGHVIAQRITYTLRNEFYAHLQKLSFRFYDNTRVGELMSRLIDDLNVVEEVLYHGPQNVVTNVSILLFAGAALFWLSPRLAAVCVAIMMLIGVFDYALALRMFRGARKVRERKASLASRLEDNLAGIRIVQSFVREGFEMQRFELENREHYHSRVEVIRPMSWIFPLSILILGVALGVGLAYGGYQSVTGIISVGALAAFIMYLQRFMWPLLTLAMVGETVTRFLAGIERYFAYMDMAPDIQDRPEAVEMENVRGDVEFRDVWFSYDDEPILKGINLRVPAGQTIALVGPSGAGKTTVTRLLPRFYEPQRGRILIDGVDVRDIKLASLRGNVGFVMQDDYLFGDTLFNNIAYGRPEASEAEKLEAARQANVNQFADQLRDGYETEIGPRGAKVSEGQAQRISIARALLKQAPIYVLDEPTSSMDSETELLIKEALDPLMRHRTCLIIAHRLSTIQNADRILFIDDGRVVEEGTHAELLERNGKYARFHAIQFGG